MWETCEYDKDGFCHINDFATNRCFGKQDCGNFKLLDKSLTITLPFHTGSCFWVTDLLADEVCEVEVTGFFVDENLTNPVWSVVASACGGWSASYEFDLQCIGKTVFKNKEDALSAMKGKE